MASADAPSGLLAPEVPPLTFHVRPNGAEGAAGQAVPVLEYFSLQALGEEARLILEETATPYNSVYYWAGTKEHTASWKSRSLTGQLPLYSGPELGNGVFISQSRAICNHLARTLADGALAGDGPIEQARNDMVVETAKDVRDKRAGLWSEGDKPKMIQLATALQDMLGDSEYFGGSKVLLGDIAAFHTLSLIETAMPGFLVENGLEKLEAFRARFAARPRIAAYLASPRRMPLTINELGDPARPWTPDGYMYLSPLAWEEMQKEGKVKG